MPLLHAYHTPSGCVSTAMPYMATLYTTACGLKRDVFYRACSVLCPPALARLQRRRLMHTASWQWGTVITGAVWGLLISLVATTWGHSDLEPRQSIPNKWETYTLNVPTETEVP